MQTANYIYIYKYRTVIKYKLIKWHHYFMLWLRKDNNIECEEDQRRQNRKRETQKRNEVVLQSDWTLAWFDLYGAKTVDSAIPIFFRAVHSFCDLVQPCSHTAVTIHREHFWSQAGQIRPWRTSCQWSWASKVNAFTQTNIRSFDAVSLWYA